MTELQPSRRPSLAFVGGGQMASALAGGLIGAGWLASQMLVIEPMDAQRARLQSALGVRTAKAPGVELEAADVVVWAVKPQVLEEAVRQAAPFLGAALHISIAAGVRSEDLAAWTSSRRVVRVMPNTAVLVGAGVSGVAALDGVGDADRALVTRILSTTGYSFWVESDERLDAVTAVSGSGPAYVFHFMEAFQAAAEAVGFSRAQARELVLRTTAGAVRQAGATDAAFATLRQNVSSKRGTTEAALAVLDREQTAKALESAVRAAHARAGEISREFGSAPKG
ncbi:pyrroline-5-carboxylate reductase [Variovorax sp. M-6]|uniref:pyrroline-5-carboxylate reductase n=1 Tax=Variovorax sp. M-6 TaxID=3233041 RepID=UPI003F94F685